MVGGGPVVCFRVLLPFRRYHGIRGQPLLWLMLVGIRCQTRPLSAASVILTCDPSRLLTDKVVAPLQRPDCDPGQALAWLRRPAASIGHDAPVSTVSIGRG